MKTMPRLNFCLALVCAAIQLVACSSRSSKPTEQDTIAIYQTIIRQIDYSDDTFGGSLDKPTLYIVRSTNDAAGNPSLPQPNSVVLSEAVQQGITTALSDLPTAIVWVDRFDQVRLDPNIGVVIDKGVIITLGNIKYESEDKVIIPASIYVANLAAGGKIYVMERKDGDWVITGTTGVEWIG